MAREVQILTLCDPCLHDDHRTEGEEVVITIAGHSSGKPRSLALCEMHRKEFFDPLFALVVEFGQQPEKPVRRNRDEVPADGEVRCPVQSCNRPYKNRNSLRSHCAEVHQRSLAQLEGKETPYPCEHCPMAFERKQQLALHAKRSHDDD